MFRTKLCLALSEQFSIPFADQIRLFKKIGFDGFFSGWGEGYDIAALRAIADEEGMYYQSIHAPFHKMYHMWYPSDETETAVSELIACLNDCAKYNIPIMVTHVFIGFDDHEPNRFGIDNYTRVVREAEKLGVKIAFENTEGEEYLAALMEEFKDSPAVGFCWDTGHQMCYNHSTDMMALYGKRLLGTHINDNLGCRDYNGKIFWHDDLHLLPFDGIADWQENARKIKESGFEGPLTFELNTVSKPDRHENDAYGRMDLTEYLTNAYIRACRVAALVQRA